MPAEGTLHVEVGTELSGGDLVWEDEVLSETAGDVYVSMTGSRGVCRLNYGGYLSDSGNALDFTSEGHDSETPYTVGANYYLTPETDSPSGGLDQIIWWSPRVLDLYHTDPTPPSGYEIEWKYLPGVGDVTSLSFDMVLDVGVSAASDATGASLIATSVPTPKDIGQPYNNDLPNVGEHIVYHWTPVPDGPLVAEMPFAEGGGYTQRVTMTPNSYGDLGLRLTINHRTTLAYFPPPPGFDGWRYGFEAEANYTNGSATISKPYTLGRRAPVGGVTVVNDVSHAIAGTEPAAWQDDSTSTYLEMESEAGNKAVAQFDIVRDASITEDWFDHLGFAIHGFKSVGDSISVWLEDSLGPVTDVVTVVNQSAASWHWERHTFPDWDEVDKAALWAAYTSVAVGAVTPLKLVVRNDSDGNQLYSYVGLRNAQGHYVASGGGTPVSVWRKAGVPNPEGGTLAVQNTLDGTWHICDNREDPPPGGTAGDGGAPTGWYHASWMRSKDGGPGSGRTGRLVVEIPD